MNAKLKAIPFFLCFALSSCVLAGSGKPVPFPNLLIYQGATRFRFGYEPEQFILSVPDENGERTEIEKIYDAYTTDRGFLLFICELKNRPQEYRLYKFDFKMEESAFLTYICTNSIVSSPRFFDCVNDYSPRFIVSDSNGKAAHAFLDKDLNIVALENGLAPFWVGEEGYATTTFFARYLENGITNENEENVFHYYDGSIVPINGVRTHFTAYSDGFFYRSREGLLYGYSRVKNGTICYGEYDYLWSDRYISKKIEIASRYVGDWNRYWYRLDVNSGVLFLFDTKSATEKAYPAEKPIHEITTIKGMGQSSFVLIESGRDYFTLNLETGLVSMVPVKVPLYASNIFEALECPLFFGKHFDLIEKYSINNLSSSLYVKEKETNKEIYVREPSSQLFYYSWIEEK